ncbi:DDE_3 domain-containing protein [Trichonephila clavipes]|nr:DDE_3 domain-containing protein [Trichonephila clavipes]
MDDNARPHRARIVEEYLEDHGLERMKWPARSPDLNPIEHLWDYLGREVAALNPPPRSLHELKQGLLCVWSSLPIPVSDNLINSMGNRCRQCIQPVIISTGRVIDGELFSLRMSPGLASKSIVGIFSFGVNLKLFCNHGTSVKEMHMDPGLVSVWDSISLGGRTDLHVFSRGNVNSHTYRDDILDAYRLPYVGAIGDAFVLQDDNARLHRSRIVDAQFSGYSGKLGHRDLTLSSSCPQPTS